MASCLAFFFFFFCIFPVKSPQSGPFSFGQLSAAASRRLPFTKTTITTKEEVSLGRERKSLINGGGEKKGGMNRQVGSTHCLFL